MRTFPANGRDSGLDPARTAVLAGLGMYNLVQNRLVPPQAYVPANLVADGVLLVVARRYGCGWHDLGMDASRVTSGLRWGVAGAGAAAAAVTAAATSRHTGSYFLDRRAKDHSPSRQLYRAAIRFPLGTALFEEVAFRGVLPGMWRRAGSGSAASALVGALAFGLWHVLPTRRALAGNPLGGRLESPSSGWNAVAVGVLFTALSSLGLSWLRERSGSLVAPWLVHAAFNTAGYLAGLVAWRRA